MTGERAGRDDCDSLGSGAGVSGYGVELPLPEFDVSGVVSDVGVDDGVVVSDDGVDESVVVSDEGVDDDEPAVVTVPSSVVGVDGTEGSVVVSDDDELLDDAPEVAVDAVDAVVVVVGGRVGATVPAPATVGPGFRDTAVRAPCLASNSDVSVGAVVVGLVVESSNEPVPAPAEAAALLSSVAGPAGSAVVVGAATRSVPPFPSSPPRRTSQPITPIEMAATTTRALVSHCRSTTSRRIERDS